MSLAKEGLSIILFFFAAAALSGLIYRLALPNAALIAAADLFFILGCFSLYFFRDPDRSIPEGDNTVLSPADGRIVDVSEAEEGFFCKKRMRKISIFLSVFDVHINRMPLSGRVVYKKYYPGKFLDARNEKSSLENEQMHIGLETGGARVLVKQIAGLIARRVVCHAQINDSITRGERFGILKFGSRTDLFLPLEWKVSVEIGQKVNGGTTILGEITGNEHQN